MSNLFIGAHGLTTTSQNNPRFSFLCLFCQISQATDATDALSSPPSSVLPQGLKDPPSYTFSTANPASTTLLDASPDGLPPYHLEAEDRHAFSLSDEKAALAASQSTPSPPYDPPAEDTLHFLDLERDTVASLSLRYNVPAHALRRANSLHSDHLLAARRTVIIPGAWYRGGVSLSPRPIEGEAEEARKAKIRRFMVATKVVEYEVAVLYLDASDYELSEAIAAYLEDEKWENDNPMGLAKGKSRQVKLRLRAS